MQIKQRQVRTNLKHYNKNCFYNPRDIANAFREYYESLYNLNKVSDTYQPSEADIADFHKPRRLPTVAAEALQQLNKQIDIGEVLAAIKELPLHKWLFSLI